MRIALLLLLLLFVTGCPNPDPPPTPVPIPVPEDLPQEIQDLYLKHCEARQNKGQSILTFNDDLYEAAWDHAQWMANHNKLSHTGANGSSFMDRSRDAGYNGSGGGENIAFGYSDVDAVMDGWMWSLGHRSNILNSRYKDVGFGVAESSSGRKYWCAVFGY